MNVLLVEDDQEKAGAIKQVVMAASGNLAHVEHRLCSTEAFAAMKERQFDLCLLDIVLPRRLGDRPNRDGGMELLRALLKDPAIHRPRYIVGISAYSEVVEEEIEEFSSNLWSLVLYSDTVDKWKAQLENTIRHIASVEKSNSFSDGVTFGFDLGVICALDDVEFEAIKRVDCNWSPLRRPFDDTRYLQGSVEIAGRQRRIIAAAAPRMGMAASAALSCKMIAAFRPKFLAMVGICAARSEKAHLGDLVVASPSWDWGSGRIESVEGKPTFAPAPHQVDLDVDVAAELRELGKDKAMLASMKAACASPKPSTEVTVHLGPLVTGAAVVADKGTFDKLLDQHRKIIGLEMEAYAVFVACQSMGRPRPKCVVIKGVSDFADSAKDDDYQAFSAELSFRFLREALPSLLEL